MSGPTLPPRFEAGPIEARWQAAWAEAGVAHPRDRPGASMFSIVLPPPNVTGVLHLGHMLGDTVSDTVVRAHRMRGDATLWVPGLDHAGLATQVEVRRRLQKQGVRLEELPREEAIHQVELWTKEHEARILEQTRAGGFSLDWDRYRYTLDPGSVRATREAFVRLYHAGLIYRGERMVNWDPRLRTAVSDLEVVHAEEEGELVYVRYPWADGAPGGMEVATVRPETIFGDVAVAVHPGDERYRAAVGRAVRVPLTDRTAPVIADPLVDPAFGAGALKVTPRHDPIDREIGLRHPELAPAVEIFDAGARLTGAGVPPDFHGLDRAAARQRAVERLGEAGLLVRREPHRHSVGRSERSDEVIEPRMSTQWFVRMGPLAAPVVAAVKAGEIRIHPDRWLPTFYRWMDGLQDWCISRQVFWGHPIPVDHCRQCGHLEVTLAPGPRCSQCGSHDLAADPDVLDTWFTSWLWPFAILGWPEPTADLDRYYPTRLLVTGRDIMFFWVARMMMAGYQFTGRPPFSDVYFTGTVRDERGRKMSKHLGNSPDPLDLIRERGADALRFSLVFPTPTDEDGPFGRAALDGGRNFLTKLWNLVRFALPHAGPGDASPPVPELPADAALEHRWILARYRRTAEEVDAAIAAFAPTRAATALHGFLWHDVADRYVEFSKEALSGRLGEPAQRHARATLRFVLERSLRLLHPIVPHVTEELWHALPHPDGLLATAPWPSPTEAPADPEAEVAMEPVLETIRLLRNVRAEEAVPADATPRAWLRAANPEVARVLAAEHGAIVRLAKLSSLALLPPGSDPPPGAGSRVAPFGECFLELPGRVAGPSAALERERERLAQLLTKTQARLADVGFRARAPPEVVAEAESKERELRERIRRIDEHMSGTASPGAAA